MYFIQQKGVDVVYESIGGEVFDVCLDRYVYESYVFCSKATQLAVNVLILMFKVQYITYSYNRGRAFK